MAFPSPTNSIITRIATALMHSFPRMSCASFWVFAGSKKEINRCGLPSFLTLVKHHSTEQPAATRNAPTTSQNIQNQTGDSINQESRTAQIMIRIPQITLVVVLIFLIAGFLYDLFTLFEKGDKK